MTSSPVDDTTRQSLYELSGVSKLFEAKGRQVVALEGVDLEIARGEFLAVQGPTGQGKSTLLALLGGLDKPTSGQILFEGRDIAPMHEGELSVLRAKSFGFVFQTFNLIQTFTALENVEAALVPLGLHAAERKERSRRALGELGLSDRLDHLPAQLSGGQQQRVAIARALVKEPTVLLADEPTGNLDEDMRDEILAVLEALWRERALTLVVVTHDSALARRAGRVALIRKGHLELKTVAASQGRRG